VSLDYNQEIQIFLFAFEDIIDIIAGVFLQKNEENMDQYIASMSKALRDYELKYSIMENKSICFSSIFKTFQNLCGVLKNHSLCSTCCSERHIDAA
jgi:hypothetical protein